MTDPKLDRWIREMFGPAGDLGSEVPVEEMWARIEPDVEDAVRAHALGTQRARVRRRSWLRRERPFFVPAAALGWAVVAALVLAVASATLVVFERSAQQATQIASVPAGAELAVVADYERAIADVEEAARSSGALSDARAGELVEALQVVDRAIGETRTALAGAPGDPYYRDHLIRNLELKLSILEGSLRL